MKATTSVSTTFAATHDRHRVSLLVTLTGEVSAARPPINVALVRRQCFGTGQTLLQLGQGLHMPWVSLGLARQNSPTRLTMYSRLRGER